MNIFDRFRDEDYELLQELETTIESDPAALAGEVDRLVELLDDGNEEVRNMAAVALAYAGREVPESLEGSLPRILDNAIDPSRFHRETVTTLYLGLYEAVEATPNIYSDDRTVEALLTTAEKTDSRYVTEQCLSLLSEIARADPEAIVVQADRVASFLDDSGDAPVQATTVLVWIAAEYPKAVLEYADKVARLLDGSDSERFRSAAYFDQIANDFPETAHEYRNPIESLLSDEYEKVRPVATGCIGTLVDELPDETGSLQEPLRQLLEDDNEEVRKQAAASFLAIAGSDPGVVERPGWVATKISETRDLLNEIPATAVDRGIELLRAAEQNEGS